MPSATPSTPSTPSAASDVALFNRKLESLIAALEAHPAMNHADPPATNKCLFFVWDFVQRTRFNLNNIDVAKLDAGDAAAVEAYKDAVGRCSLTNIIISDTSGRTAAQICGGKSVDFGPDVRAKSAALRPDRPAVA